MTNTTPPQTPLSRCHGTLDRRWTSRRPIRHALRAGVALVAMATAACAPRAVSTTSIVPAGVYDPVRDLGALFHDVQMARVFPDSKTFVDATPRQAPVELVRIYAAEKDRSDFSIATFVRDHFVLPPTVGGNFTTDPTRSMEDHIRQLWPVLTRAPDSARTRSTLLPLPEPYVVPGGRFREVYYWDSYFTMQGLVVAGRTDLVGNMLDNFAWLIKTVGHIPNGNRSYYLGRSQPPYFAAMVGLYARATDSSRALVYLGAMETEYAFWMEGSEALAPGTAHRRVVRLRDGTLLNRYWDDIPAPRPESYREDFTLGESLPVEQRETFYRQVRAAAESGWDFSSRWMRDPKDLRSLETTDLAPVDLNSLLYHSERTIAALRRRRNGPGDRAVAARFEAAAARRRQAVQSHMYDPTEGFFFDLRWATDERVTDRPTLAAASPLYFGLATEDEGKAVAARLERDFLRAGGFVTTLINSGQQWDAPNGWPPLQWLSMEGVRRYGRSDLANTARDRWLALNRRIYAATGKMTEKYDVLDANRS
ncbi:MAG: alpha,alpha-trehalase TreF, partial [Gemmatimonadota bacterium]